MARRRATGCSGGYSSPYTRREYRARYGEEMLARLADSAQIGPSGAARTAASVCRGAARAWLAPARHLHSAASRLRASLAMLLVMWVALAAAALVFGQLNEDQATLTVTPGHPITHRLFTGYTVAAHLSVGVLLAAALRCSCSSCRPGSGAAIGAASLFLSRQP